MQEEAFETVGELNPKEIPPPPYLIHEEGELRTPYRPPEGPWMKLCLTTAPSMDDIIGRLRYPDEFEGSNPRFNYGVFEVFMSTPSSEPSSDSKSIQRVLLQQVKVTGIERLERSAPADDDTFVVSGTCFVDRTKVCEGHEIDTSFRADFKMEYDRHHHLSTIYLKPK